MTKHFCLEISFWVLIFVCDLFFVICDLLPYPSSNKNPAVAKTMSFYDSAACSDMKSRNYSKGI